MNLTKFYFESKISSIRTYPPQQITRSKSANNDTNAASQQRSVQRGARNICCRTARAEGPGRGDNSWPAVSREEKAAAIVIDLGRWHCDAAAAVKPPLAAFQPSARWEPGSRGFSRGVRERPRDGCLAAGIRLALAARSRRCGSDENSRRRSAGRRRALSRRVSGRAAENRCAIYQRAAARNARRAKRMLQARPALRYVGNFDAPAGRRASCDGLPGDSFFRRARLGGVNWK